MPTSHRVPTFAQLLSIQLIQLVAVPSIAKLKKDIQ